MEKWRIDLAKEALELALKLDMHFSYNPTTNGIHLMRKRDFKFTQTMYLDWKNDEEVKELFNQLKSSAYSLSNKIEE